MAFCSRCGAQFEGQFCTACGAPASAAASGPSSAPVASSGGLSTNMASTLCYALGFITGIIFLLIAPYNTIKIVRFHAFQSIFMSLALFVLNIVISTVLPFGMLLLVSPLISLATLGLWIFLLIKTYQGSKTVLPIIGPLAEQQA